MAAMAAMAMAGNISAVEEAVEGAVQGAVVATYETCVLYAEIFCT